MSVEPSEIASEVWTRWQGHVINGVFPLGRYLGGSDHSGVFLTRCAGRPAEFAIKLVPTNRALAESQLPRWKRAGGLAHPHLLRLLECGGCQLDGLPYLFAVMEYADQTLAQLLQHRAMTDDEAREMLSPILDALQLLHGRNLVQGQLKPANILVVGDQLKLASDTMRRVTEGMIGNHTLTPYDPPEAWHGSYSAAGDVWGLGVSLFEALARRAPAGSSDLTDEVVLPGDFPSAFRNVVARCLRIEPQDRPSVTELAAWARARAPEPAPAMAVQPAPSVTPGTTAPEPVAPGPVTPESLVPESVAPESVTPEPMAPKSTAPEPMAPASAPLPRATHIDPEAAAGPVPPDASEKRWGLLPVILGAILILTPVWVGVRMFRSHRAPAPPPPTAQAPAESLSPTSAPNTPAAAELPSSRSTVPTTKPARNETATPLAVIHEVIPDVPWSARRTIRGHINVWVRVIVDQDGSVLGAMVDRSGPSRYFQRVAVDAAKQWTFAPADTPSQRVTQLRFDFSRDGTSGHPVSVH